jgi:Virulence-associated protein E
MPEPQRFVHMVASSAIIREAELFLFELPIGFSMSITLLLSPTYKSFFDTTGNRRWWPVKLHGRIDLSGLVRDRDQIWAEAVAAEATDESLVIPESLWGVAAIEQQARMEIDAWLEPISDHLAKLETKRANKEGMFWSDGTDKYCVPEFRVSSAYLLDAVLSISESHRGPRETKRLADVMRTLGWQLAQYPIKVGKKTCRAYFKPQPQS